VNDRCVLVVLAHHTPSTLTSLTDLTLDGRVAVEAFHVDPSLEIYRAIAG